MPNSQQFYDFKQIDMNPDPYESSRETGKRVWESLISQIEEAKGFLKAMGESILSVFNKSFFYYFLTGLIASMIAAGVFVVKPTVYEAEMTVSYIHFEKKIYADMILKLDFLVQSGNHTTLSELLDLPTEVVWKIKSVSGLNIHSEALVTDLSTERIPFYIRVKVVDLGILDALETSIVSFLNNQPVIQSRLKYTIEKSKRELKFLEKRLSVVDSLSNLLIIRKEGISDEKAITRMELLQEALTLHDRIEMVKDKLEYNRNIEVLDGFVPIETRNLGALKKFLFIGFLIGFGVRFLWKRTRQRGVNIS